MRIVNLSSGSKANSTFVGYNDTKILIDVGLAPKTLSERLSEIGENLENIKAVLITHEHSDHIKALKTLAKKYDIDFYIHRDLILSGFLVDIKFKKGKLHEFTDEEFDIGDLEIMPFAVSHDAIAPVGFTIKVKGSKSKFGIVTDTGIVTDNMKKQLAGSKIVFIESNYDEDMLLNGSYPYPVKQRIYGEKGHLSNEQSLELAKFLFENGTKCFALSHISQNNNTYDLAFTNYINFFESAGYVLDKDVFVRISYQDKHGNNFILKEESYE